MNCGTSCGLLWYISSTYNISACIDKTERKFDSGWLSGAAGAEKITWGATLYHFCTEKFINQNLVQWWHAAILKDDEDVSTF